MKIKIIGHRGAAGLAIENTLESIRRALSLSVDAIEIDVHLSGDQQVVVSHDPNLERMTGVNLPIATTPFNELKKHKYRNGEHLPLLSTIVKEVGETPLIVEIKSPGTVAYVLQVVDRFPKANIIIASPIYDEIRLLKELRPGMRGYIRVVTNPLEGLYTARALKANGLDMNFWILNPFTYYLCRHYKLDLMVYTINHRWLAHAIHLLYPQVLICTDNPHYFTRRKR